MLTDIFGVEKPIIGMVHLKELKGQRGFRGIHVVMDRALQDAEALVQGGINGLCVENWEDTSKGPFISSDMAECIAFVAREIVAEMDIPVGVNILPNDYRVAFSLSWQTRIRFVWLDVFVDQVRTDKSQSTDSPFEIAVDFEDLKKQRGNSARTLLLASIHPRHYTMLEKSKTIEQSAAQAIEHGADALVITKLMGVAPDIRVLKRVKECVGRFPVLVGSGFSHSNAQSLLSVVDGAIVGTAIKTKRFNRIVTKKVRDLMDIVARVRK